MRSKDLVLARGIPAHPVIEHGGEEPAGYLPWLSLSVHIRAPLKSVLCVLAAGDESQGFSVRVHHDMDIDRGGELFETYAVDPHFIRVQTETWLGDTRKILPADYFKASFAPCRGEAFILH